MKWLKAKLTASSSLNGIARNESGAVALMLGLAMLPIAMAVGVAVDHGNQVDVMTKLQAATDAAALAAGKDFDKSEEEMQAVADQFFFANFGETSNSTAPTISVTKDDANGNECLSVVGAVTVKNRFMKLASKDQNVLTAEAEACRATTGMELILVFDNTGSMNNYGRLGALKEAATHLTNILFGDKQSSETLKIGIVPFSSAVNVGSEYASANWIDKTGAAAYSKLNFKSSTWHNWKAWNKISNRSWTGCVEARQGSLAVDDTPPTTGDTLFTPFFAPDEPGNSQSTSEVNGNQYRNSYLPDSKTNSLDNRQRHQGKYKNATVSTTSRGPDRGCSVQPLTPLTGTKQTILDAIGSMVASGYTHIPEGIGWGLRVISPGEPFTEGTEFNNPKIPKVMIMLTDGENTFDSESNHNDSTYTAYGYLDQARLGSSNYSSAIGAMNNLTAEACNNVKNAGVTVYSFAYQVYDTTAKNIMRNCASDPEKFFDPPSNTQLVQYFEQIADELRGLYLSK